MAADAVKAAPADGTTIMVMPIGPMAVVPHTTKLLSFDPLKDFAPIGIGSTFDFAVAVGPQSGAKTWGEYVTWAKANPAKSSYATSGAGSLPHFFGVQIGREAGMEMLHVAYKGSAAYMNDLIGGQVPAAIDTVADLSEMHKAGRVRILATSGPQRSTVVPDVPTLTELGFKNLETGGWFGFFAHVNTPPAIVQIAQPPSEPGAALARRHREAARRRHGACDEHARGVRASSRRRLRALGCRGESDRVSRSTDVQAALRSDSAGPRGRRVARGPGAARRRPAQALR